MDNLFKPLLIVILLAFLYLYYENSNNDRYYHSAEQWTVFDKKTGIVYKRTHTEQFESINYFNGTVKRY